MPLLGATPYAPTPDTFRIDRRARQRRRTRARLVAAGQRIIGVRGLEGTAIADIAQEADVGVGSFYNYFRSKDELLAVRGLDVSPRFFAALRDRCGSVAFAGA